MPGQVCPARYAEQAAPLRSGNTPVAASQPALWGPRYEEGVHGPPHPVALGLRAPLCSRDQEHEAVGGAAGGVYTAQSSAHMCVPMITLSARGQGRALGCAAGEAAKALEGSFSLQEPCRFPSSHAWSPDQPGFLRWERDPGCTGDPGPNHPRHSRTGRRRSGLPHTRTGAHTHPTQSVGASRRRRLCDPPVCACARGHTLGAVWHTTPSTSGRVSPRDSCPAWEGDPPSGAPPYLCRSLHYPVVGGQTVAAPAGDREVARCWPGSLLFITGLCGARCRGGASLRAQPRLLRTWKGTPSGTGTGSLPWLSLLARSPGAMTLAVDNEVQDPGG